MIFALARELGLPAFLFQEGADPDVGRVFGEIARLTKGVHCSFSPGAAGELAELLRAVATFATGGRHGYWLTKPLPPQNFCCNSRHGEPSPVAANALGPYQRGRSRVWLKMKNPEPGNAAGVGGVMTTATTSAQFEIKVDGVVRSCRDVRDTAIEAARFLQAAQSERQRGSTQRSPAGQRP